MQDNLISTRDKYIISIFCGNSYKGFEVQGEEECQRVKIGWIRKRKAETYTLH